MTHDPLTRAAPAAPTTIAAGAARGMTRRLTAILAVTCAVAVGHIYFPQAVGPLAAAAVALVLACVVRFTVPVTSPSTRQPYRALLAESLRLLRTEPGLRHSCVNQAAVFAAFSAVWTCVGLLLTGPAYGLGAGTV